MATTTHDPIQLPSKHGDNRKAGIALIAGSVGGMLTMAIHPTAGGPMTAADVRRLSMVSGVAHSLALVSVLLLFLGACGVYRWLAADDRLSLAALVTYGFSCVAIMIAAAVSGYIVPAMLQRMVRDVPEAAHTWQIVTASIFEINQAFSRIYSVGSAVAISLWSVSALRNGRMAKGVAVYGCVSAVATAIAIGSGHLRLNVHGMAAVMLAEVIWFVLVGARLLSSPEA